MPQQAVTRNVTASRSEVVTNIMHTVTVFMTAIPKRLTQESICVPLRQVGRLRMAVALGGPFVTGPTPGALIKLLCSQAN